MSRRKKDNPLPDFCDRFNRLRNDRDMNQAEFAEYLGISRPTVGFYENGDRIPDARTLATIAEKCEVTSDYLLGRTDAKKPENINAVEKYGLSEKALDRLEEMHAYKRNEGLTRTVNALLESGEVLGAIEQYLYFDLPENEEYQSKGIFPFRVVYKYSKKGDNSQWGDNEKSLGVYSMTEAMTNDIYKRIVMIEIQEQLHKMLKQEDQTERF
jgi:transcriptional regulator with XRE-family HTH domain